MIKDYFVIPFKEIKQRKLRSFLTLLGIIIGITAVISLITLGQGMQNAITKQFTSLGKDKLFITAKGNILTAGTSTDVTKLTNNDLELVRKISGVRLASGFIYTTTKIEYNNKVRYFFAYGMPSDSQESALINSAQNYKILKGRDLTKGEKYKTVLGYEYSQPDLFGKEVSLSDKILINNQEFKVVGFWQKTGSPPDDKAAMIPIDTYQEIFNKPKELGMVLAQTQPGENPTLIAEKITKELRKSRHVKEGKEDFSIQTPEQLASAFSTILDIVQIVLIGIACISLLVGGIGIMNTMYTSVLQRTKEIGVMKALGAKNSQIMSLFLIESGFYGLGGGIIGAIIGISIAKFAEYSLTLYLGPSFLTIEISWSLVIGTLFFSFIVGCLSGIAPAVRASKLNPVESLRYE